VASEPGKGSTGAPRSLRSKGERDGYWKLGLGPIKVLIADGNARNRQLAKVLLDALAAARQKLRMRSPQLPCSTQPATPTHSDRLAGCRVARRRWRDGKADRANPATSNSPHHETLQRVGAARLEHIGVAVGFKPLSSRACASNYSHVRKTVEHRRRARVIERRVASLDLDARTGGRDVPTNRQSPWRYCKAQLSCHIVANGAGR
jgi:hypothetical protein